MLTEIDSLTIPDPIAAAHSQELFNFICSEIKTHGPINFARYMQLALYAPGLGYYSAGARKFGVEGDFVTAPEISPLFSRCIAQQCQQALTELNGGDILEFGAGSGIMAADLLTELEKQNCLPEHYYILEISADLRQRQQQLLKYRLPHLFSRVQWLDALPAHKIKGLILANEVLDAMPVHKFKIEKKIQEFYVAYNNNQLTWQLSTASPVLQQQISSYGIAFAEGYESEINLMLNAWIKSVSDILSKGLVLIIDYGFPRHEYYHPDRNTGTLMCHHQHRAHDKPLIYPGLQDITAHVDFTLAAESADNAGLNVAGYTTQESFLLSCGITDIPFATDPMQQLKISQQIKKLTLPSEMGELFKVMALTRDLDIPLIGFNLYDKRERL